MAALFRAAIDLNRPGALNFKQPEAYLKYLHRLGHGKLVDISVKS